MGRTKQERIRKRTNNCKANLEEGSQTKQHVHSMDRRADRRCPRAQAGDTRGRDSRPLGSSRRGYTRRCGKTQNATWKPKWRKGSKAVVAQTARMRQETNTPGEQFKQKRRDKKGNKPNKDRTGQGGEGQDKGSSSGLRRGDIAGIICPDEPLSH